MRRQHRIALAVLLAVVLVAILAPTALAAAGGGSAGFGGGGGGGGGEGGGRGGGLYIVIQILIRIALLGHGVGALALIAVAILYVLLRNGVPWMRNFWTAQESSGRAARRRSAQRERRVELAAAEAAEVDPAFAPDVVRPAAKKLYTEIQGAWDAGDRIHLGELMAPDLLAEWERRLDDFEGRGWRTGCSCSRSRGSRTWCRTNRGSDNWDRVVVRIEAKLRDYVEDGSGTRIKRIGRLSDKLLVREFWTLSKRDGDWILRSIEQGAEGAHTLDEQLVPSPWSDDGALRDEALVERAVADAVPEGTSIAEVADVDFEGTARAAALDLSLADGRFAPDVLEVAARRAIAAWADAVDGDDVRLARPSLNRKRPRTFCTRAIRATELASWSAGPRSSRSGSPASTPPRRPIDGDRGRYRGQALHRGSRHDSVGIRQRSRSSSFTEHWTLVCDGDKTQPWRVAAVGAPAGRA